MTRALERTASEATRCLAPGTGTVTVAGEFEGASGEFHAARVAGAGGAALPYAVETCVRVAAERAHVRPFRDESAAFAYTYAPAAAAPSPSTSAPPASTVASTPAVTASATTGSIAIGGGPTPAELIRREGDALQRCYEQACERDHTIAGTIELRFALDAAGRITRLASRVSTTHEDATLMDLVARCIESHVRLIQFGPQAQPDVEITVPLTFTPGGTAAP